LRRNYAWIFAIQGISYLAKISIHPTPLRTLDELWARAAIGPLSGQVTLLVGALWHASWILLAYATSRQRQAIGRVGGPDNYEDSILKVGIKR
jgi:uncharacterized membrane protein